MIRSFFFFFRIQSAFWFTFSVITDVVRFIASILLFDSGMSRVSFVPLLLPQFVLNNVW